MGNEIDNYTYNKAAFDLLPIGVTIFDENMQIIECNNTILNLLGTTREYYIEHFFDLSPEYQPNGDNSREKALEAMKRALNGENLTIEWMYLSAKGELIPFEVILSRTKKEDRYLGLGYQFDMRHVKQMTEELKKQSALLKVRLEQQELISEISRSFVSSDNTQMLVDEALAKLGHYYKATNVIIQKLDYENEKTTLAYNWSEKNKINKREILNVYELVKTSFPERLYNSATVPILSSADTSISKASYLDELAKINVTAFICAPLYVEGKLWGMLAVEQSDLPRQWTDSEKSFAAMTASTIAGAITLDIYNTKLKDAVTELTAASKAKSEFLSNMSHEMRTPMNAIINMTVIAKNSAEIERKNYALDKIGEASSHLLGVINDILDMSKIEANKFEIVPVEFNFEKMLGSVINVVNFRVEEKYQKLSVNIDKEIPKILIGDDQRISQITANLLGNAVKFTPEKGSIKLDAQFMGEQDGTCTIQISISDTGIGISKSHQEHLFQSFHQAESSTARTYGGTGLGLSISKSFVEMMGGTIWVNSEYGKGSTFAFTVQVKRGKEINESEQLVKTNIEYSNDFNGHHILLVEDMEINREIVLMLLESTNIKIDCAENGLQAVEMFIDNPDKYEIIFMDVHMPGMDGYEATRQIRTYEEKLRKKNQCTSFAAGETRSDNRNSHKRIPIIAMTANVFKEDIENCINSGMDSHLGKPLDFELVMQKLRDYLIS